MTTDPKTPYIYTHTHKKDNHRSKIYRCNNCMEKAAHVSSPEARDSKEIEYKMAFATVKQQTARKILLSTSTFTHTGAGHKSVLKESPSL